MSTLRKLTNPLAVLILLSAGYALSFFQRVSPAVLAPDLMEAFSLDPASFSLITSATMLGYALTQIPSGLLADLVGGRRTLALYQVLAGLFCILFTFCQSLVPAVACRFLLGLTLASNVPSYKILAASVPANRYALYCSVLTGCGTIGSFMASAPLVAASNLVGWRAALLTAGVFAVFLGCSIFLLISDGRGSDHAPSVRENLRALREGLREVSRMRNFWLLFLWFLFAIGNLFIVLTTWWGSFLMQGCGLSKEDAGMSMIFMSIVPLCLILVFPWLSDNVFHTRKYFLVASALMQCIVFACICLHRDSVPGFLEVTVLGTFFGVFTSCMGPISFTMVKESVPTSALASACGFLNCGAPVLAALFQGLFGSILALSLEAGVAPVRAYGNAFLLLLSGSTVALLASLFLKDTIRR